MYKGLLVLVLSSVLFAQVPNFYDSLSSAQKKTLGAVAQNYTPLSGAGRNLEELSKPPVSRSSPAYRLYNFAAWAVMNDVEKTKVFEMLNKRDSLFLTAVPATDTILSSGTTALAGDSAAPILISFYMTSGCPACKQVGVALYDLATGPLAGRVAVSMRPIRSSDGDKALLAANEQGEMWTLFTGYAENSSRLDRLVIMEIAENKKLDVSGLMKTANENEKEYTEILAGNRAEGRAHGLRFTPTLFFNGIRYTSNRHPLWILDYIEYLEQ